MKAESGCAGLEAAGRRGNDNAVRHAFSLMKMCTEFSPCTER